MNTIATQADLDAFVASFSWEDAFIREAHILSPSYLRAEDAGVSVVAPDAGCTLRLLVCSPDKRTPGVELLFDDAVRVEMVFRVDLEPSGTISRSGIEFRLSRNALVVARQLRVAPIGEEAWGYRVRYGIENYFDEGGFPQGG